MDKQTTGDNESFVLKDEIEVVTNEDQISSEEATETNLECESSKGVDFLPANKCFIETVNFKDIVEQDLKKQIRGK